MQIIAEIISQTNREIDAEERSLLLLRLETARSLRRRFQDLTSRRVRISGVVPELRSLAQLEREVKALRFFNRVLARGKL